MSRVTMIKPVVNEFRNKVLYGRTESSVVAFCHSVGDTIVEHQLFLHFLAGALLFVRIMLAVYC